MERKTEEKLQFSGKYKSGIGVKQTLVIPSYHKFDEVFLVLLSALEAICYTPKFLAY